MSDAISDERIAEIAEWARSNIAANISMLMRPGEVSAILTRMERAEAERDEALKYGCREQAVAFLEPLEPCKHNPYWITISGNCMACRAEKAEAALAAKSGGAGK